MGCFAAMTQSTLVFWNLVQQVAGVHDGQTFERAGRTMVLFDNERSMRGFIDNIRTLNITYTNNLRDAMIERLRGAGIQVNDNIEEGRFVLESFSKKSAVSERNGEVAGNSSSDSLLSSRKDHLSRHPLPNSKDGANLQRNTEIAKIKLKKIKNSGGILIKDGNAAGNHPPVHDSSRIFYVYDVMTAFRADLSPQNGCICMVSQNCQ